MNPSDVPTLDLEVFVGISYPLSFSYSHINDAGTVTGPYDLTGWDIAVIFKHAIHSETLTLLSSDGETLSGSICEITNAANGEFRFLLSALEMSDPHQADGDWRIEMRQGEDVEMLVRGHFRFLPDTTGGEI